MNNLINTLNLEHKNLVNHPTYKLVNDVDTLKVFMKAHVFAVWDFMSLLKALQRRITCIDVPWTPSPYPKEVVRMINEIVLGEESDLDYEGRPCDHFTLYLDAMKEVGADTSEIESFLKDFDLNKLNSNIKKFVSFNLDLAMGDDIHRVASAFFYGREKLIPDMFETILADIKAKNLDCPALIYYLERHIELDGDEHGDLAYGLLKSLCGEDEERWQEAYESGIESLKLRSLLWDEVKSQIENNRPSEALG